MFKIFSSKHPPSATMHGCQALCFSLCVIMIYTMGCFGLAELINSVRFDVKQDEIEITQKLSDLFGKENHNETIQVEILDVDTDTDASDEIFVNDFLQKMYEIQVQTVSRRNQRMLNKDKQNADEVEGRNSEAFAKLSDGHGGRKTRSAEDKENPKSPQKNIILKTFDLIAIKNSSWYKRAIEILLIMLAVCVSAVCMIFIFICSDQCLTPQYKGQHCKHLQGNKKTELDNGQKKLVKDLDDKGKCGKCSILHFDIEDNILPPPKRVNIFRPDSCNCKNDKTSFILRLKMFCFGKKRQSYSVSDASSNDKSMIYKGYRKSQETEI